jgi:hypothetical protein
VFADAYEIAARFTVPVVVSMRLHTGEVHCSVGSAIVVNEAGWLVTVAHVLEPLDLHRRHQPQIAAYDSAVAAIGQGAGTAAEKQSRIEALDDGNRWIRNSSIWFGRDEWSVPTFQVLAAADLAIGKIDNFDPGVMAGYPAFRDPTTIRCGESVCRLGFPFHEITATYDDERGAFELGPGSLPIPRFPNEGMITRFLDAGTDNGISITSIETSTAGLRGQSGGPVFDVAGAICGMQSKTAHLPLGFSPEVLVDGQTITEHQFMNVGLAVHAQTMLDFFGRHGVRAMVA